MKGQMHTDLGQVIIDEEVIATYAGINAIECFGIEYERWFCPAFKERQCKQGRSYQDK